jgi:hypothetical protein
MRQEDHVKTLGQQIAELEKEALKNRWSQASYDRKKAELLGKPDPKTKRTIWDNIFFRK